MMHIMDYVAEIAAMKLPFEPVDLPISKRIFDIIFGLLLLLLSLPFILFVLFFSWIEQIFVPSSRGPFFYSELRISKGKPFQLYKFRIFKTTSINSYKNEHGFVQTKDLEGNKNNLTFIGRILKQIYMDELPQLFNVLKGDMTLVGPRPSNEVVTWQDGKEGRFQRYLLTCGLTGPFQTNKGSAVPLNQNQVDMEYILFCKNSPGWKIVLADSKILFETVITVVKAKGI